MDKPLNEVAFTASFLAHAKAEGMTEAELETVVRVLSADPEAGDLIAGSGGCRKVRIARSGGGKSGGYRVVTFFARRDMPVYVFAVLAKGTRVNFSDSEVQAMASAAKRILAGLRPRVEG